jgi:hypothetical protein
LDYLTISVLSKESLAEKSEALFKNYGGWLNLVVSFIVALIGAYTGSRIYKHKQQ